MGNLLHSFLGLGMKRRKDKTVGSEKENIHRHAVFTSLKAAKGAEMKHPDKHALSFSEMHALSVANLETQKMHICPPSVAQTGIYK